MRILATCIGLVVASHAIAIPPGIIIEAMMVVNDPLGRETFDLPNHGNDVSEEISLLTREE